MEVGNSSIVIADGSGSHLKDGKKRPEVVLHFSGYYAREFKYLGILFMSVGKNGA